MALLGMREVSWGFGDPPLLENISFQIEKGQRVCLLGRNGVGKSTLLKLLAGSMQPDRGDVWRQQGITVAALEQDVPPGTDGTVFDVVAEGLGKMGRALVEYRRRSRGSGAAETGTRGREQAELQQILETGGGWALARQVESALSRTLLEPESVFVDLSAGMKRRTLFARALAQAPDVLLLDEPTNHLDLDTIRWLEDFILRHVPTLLFVTHDRAFLKRIANRILELDRGRVAAYDADYAAYLKRREAALEVEERQAGVFDRKLSQEEAWIRQGVKARRTRNEGRVRALRLMREAYRARRAKTGNVRLQLQEAERSGKLVIEAQGVGFSHGEAPIVRDFSTVILRGDKVGIIGANGTGKTTLLRLLLKETAPDAGRVHHGTHLQVAYFDQLRSQLDLQKSVRENIGEGNDFIVHNGQKRHVIGYLQDFLFTPERCRTPVYVLSGGEKNRLLLAKLFARPANLLVLDEPTNDLDIETLELLEALLVEFPGTLLLVSHDRAFLNHVVTSTIAFEGSTRAVEYAGGYDDWLSQRPPGAPKSRLPAGQNVRSKSKLKPAAGEPRKLGYMQMRELTDLPRRIEALEAEQQALFVRMSDPRFYQKDKTEIAAVKSRLDTVGSEIERAYRRWEELENLSAHP